MQGKRRYDIQLLISVTAQVKQNSRIDVEMNRAANLM